MESIGRELQRVYTGFSKATRIQGSAGVLTERKSMASIYIMCRALIAATQSISKDSLPEAVGNSLEELTFEQFRRPDVKMLTQSVNHRTAGEIYVRATDIEESAAQAIGGNLRGSVVNVEGSCGNV